MVASRHTAGGAHVSFAFGFSVRWLAPALRDGEVRIEPEVSVRHAHAEVAAEWERRRGALFVRLRLAVPIQAGWNAFGYLPWLSLGRTWSFP